ncbi:MAG: Uncharacterized YnfA/UPF0060 family, partial [Gammaproteobacteria bacterium]|nr:Uncharacterized YnfA/UPF0060 family [Gammaproteobacteria bacterium]
RFSPGARVAAHPIYSAAMSSDAAYGGVYVAVAMLWLWKVDRVLSSANIRCRSRPAGHLGSFVRTMA